MHNCNVSEIKTAYQDKLNYMLLNLFIFGHINVLTQAEIFITW